MSGHKYYLFKKGSGGMVKTLLVEPELHGHIKAYALEKDISIIEATYIILGKGLASIYGLPDEDIDQIK